MNQNISHCYLTPFRVLFGHEHFMCMTIYTLTILHQVYFSYIRAAYSKSFFYSVYYTLSIRYTSSSLEATRQDTNEILLSESLSLSLSLLRFSRRTSCVTRSFSFTRPDDLQVSSVILYSRMCLLSKLGSAFQVIRSFYFGNRLLMSMMLRFPILLYCKALVFRCLIFVFVVSLLLHIWLSWQEREMQEELLIKDAQVTQLSILALEESKAWSWVTRDVTSTTKRNASTTFVTTVSCQQNRMITIPRLESDLPIFQSQNHYLQK